MARNQRGGKAQSDSKTTDKGEKEAEMSGFSPNSSDDEAPEEVTFAESKSDALRCLKETLNTVRREKEQLKEKRRRRQELFQEQKKRRLLPVDVLEEMDSSSKKQTQPEDGDEEEQEQEEGEEEEGRRKKTKRGKLSHFRNLKGNYKVATLKEGAAASYQQRAAQDFIQSRLYGPGSCRTTNNELLSLQNKSSSNKAAAIQFLKKDWASEQRVKAEKLKKQWIHRQGVQSS